MGASTTLRLLVLCLALAGCASYGERMASVESHLSAGRTDAALKELDSQQARGDPLLRELNRGMVLHLAGAYRDSIAAFERAKDRMRSLEAISVSETAGSVTVSENLGDYAGELHDRLFLHVYQMLNHLQVGDLDGALVEARQVDLELRRLDSDAGRAPFGVDAFPRYLSGIVFEAAGEDSDAMIAYRKAWQAYSRPDGVSGPVPRSLQRSLVRLAGREGLTEELETYRERFGIDPDQASGAAPGEGELVLVFHAGLAPVKREQSVLSQDPRSGRMYRISLPEYVSRSPRVRGAVLAVGDRHTATEPVADVDRIARRLLQERLPGMTARAIARNVVKGVAAHEVGEHHQGLGFLLNLVGVITEQADTRSWQTLPDNLQLARLTVPAGNHDVRVQVAGQTGPGRELNRFEDVPVSRGELRVLVSHWVGY